MSESVTIRHEELYEQVWAEPMIRLAERTGLPAPLCVNMSETLTPSEFRVEGEEG